MDKFNISVNAILYKNGKALLIQRAGTKFYNGHFSFVAGHLELGEDPVQAIKREIEEEIGFTEDDFSKLAPQLHATRIYSDYTYIDFFYTADLISEKEIILEDDKVKNPTWVNPFQPPEKTIDYIATVLRHISDPTKSTRSIAFFYDAVEVPANSVILYD